MFNRKITGQAFDEALDDLSEEAFTSPATNPAFLSGRNPSQEQFEGDIDLETGEVLMPSAPKPLGHNTDRPFTPPRIPPRARSQSNSSMNAPTLPKAALPLDVTRAIIWGSPALMSLLISGGIYFYYSQDLDLVRTQMHDATQTMARLREDVTEVQSIFEEASQTNEANEVDQQIDEITQSLEDLEQALTDHVQESKKQRAQPALKKISPTASLKPIIFIGSYSKDNQSYALLSIQGVSKHVLLGQTVIGGWTIAQIQLEQITLSHIDGISHIIYRKPPIP